MLVGTRVRVAAWRNKSRGDRLAVGLATLAASVREHGHGPPGRAPGAGWATRQGPVRAR
ncbi:hypothetical protein KNE206_29450 [Kitasatospora sp. NE20-6]